MRTRQAIIHMACAGRPTSRTAWLQHQCAVAVALPAVLPANGAVLANDGASVMSGGTTPGRDGAELAAAYAAFADALSGIPTPGGVGSGGGSAKRTGDLVVDLDLRSALALIRAHGRPLLKIVRRTGELLYRGEALSISAAESGDGGIEGGSPRAVVETPDLLDEETYGSPVAAEYFRTADAAMGKDFHAPARPSNAHIMVSDEKAAAAWGTACSVWPLGDSLEYSWLRSCSELWDPNWERPGGRSPPANGDREAFFWRDEDRLRDFLADGLRINSGLPEAIRRGHEVLVRSGGFSLGSETSALGNDIVIRDAFVCIPASEDRAVRAGLRVPAAPVRHN